MTPHLTLAKPQRKSNKRPTIAERVKGKALNELDVTQWAMEQLQKRLAKVEAAHNANDSEMRELHIKINVQAMEIKRLRERVQRGDGE